MVSTSGSSFGSAGASAKLEVEATATLVFATCGRVGFPASSASTFARTSALSKTFLTALEILPLSADMSTVISFDASFIFSAAIETAPLSDAFDAEISAAAVESEDGGSGKSLPSSSTRSGSVSGMPESSGFKVGMPFGPITKLGIVPPHKSMPPLNAPDAEDMSEFKS